MARLLHWPGANAVPVEQPVEALDAIRGEGWLWLDLDIRDGLETLTGIVELDDPDLEDVLTPTELPKHEERTDYLIVVAHTPSAEGDRFRTEEVDLILGRDFLVTIHRGRPPGIEALQESLASTTLHGPADVFARLLKVFAARFLTLTNALDDALDELEEAAIAGEPGGLEQIQALRRDAIRLRRIMVPLREAGRSITDGDSPLLDASSQRAIKAATDDFATTLESVETSRLLMAAVLDTYRASVAERMNEVMKVLTVFSAIVLPLGLLAGIYGMNFVNMPELEVEWAYYALLGLMATLGLGLWIYFARRGFIGGPRVPRVDRVVGRGLSAFLHLTLAPARAVRAGDRDEE